MSSRVTRSTSQREVIQNEASNDSSAMDDDNESTHSVQAPTKSRAGKGTWIEKNNDIKVKPWKRSMRKVEFVSTVGYVHCKCLNVLDHWISSINI